jgi:hypothetical protein
MQTVWLIVSASIVANLGVLIVWAVFSFRYQ